jgi:hypothetical protein
LVFSLPITAFRGGTDGQSNGGCIRYHYDIDVSVRVAGNAKSPTLSTLLGSHIKRHIWRFLRADLDAALLAGVCEVKFAK